MTIRVVQEVIVVAVRCHMTFQKELNYQLDALDKAGKNVADIRYHMACHGDKNGETVAEYTALILIGG